MRRLVRVWAVGSAAAGVTGAVLFLFFMAYLAFRPDSYVRVMEPNRAIAITEVVWMLLALPWLLAQAVRACRR